MTQHREQPVPDVSAADVDRVVERDYPPELRVQVLATLQQYGTEEWHREPERVRLAALKLAGGNLTRLRSQIELAKLDYRDVLAAAEYPCFTKRQLQRLRPEEIAQVIDDDWKQYQRWLLR